MKIARFMITPELLSQCLHLPDGTVIINTEKMGHYFGITVLHEGLKEAVEGELPEARPSFNSSAGEVWFEDWGQ